MVIYLFVCFCLNRLGIPTRRFPENLVKIWLDLAEILWIWKIVCLFVCLIVCLFYYLFLFESSGDIHRKIARKFLKDQTWCGQDFIDINIVYLSVCLFVCFYFVFESFRGTNRKISWKFCENLNWFGWDIVDILYWLTKTKINLIYNSILRQFPTQNVWETMFRKPFPQICQKWLKIWMFVQKWRSN